MVFNKEVAENANGIEAPDLIGWQGGQPLTLKNGKKLFRVEGAENFFTIGQKQKGTIRQIFLIF